MEPTERSLLLLCAERGEAARLAKALAGLGGRVVATPFGPEWFPYLMRRLAERPANLGFFVRNAFRG